MISTTEILTLVGVVIGSGIGTFASVKKIPFFKRLKSKEDACGCPFPDCHDKVVLTSGKVDMLEKQNLEIFERLEELPGKIVATLKDAKILFAKGEL